MFYQVRKNLIYNIIGVVLPTFVGIYAVRLLLHNLGADRMGIFTLALGIVGFAGIFDLGLGRSLTHTVATATGQGRSLGVIANLLCRTLPIVFLMGAAWGVVLWISAGFLVRNVFHLEAELSAEAILGIRWLAAAIPALLLSTSLIGVLEGLQKFSLVNLLKVPLGVLSFLAPALSAIVWQNVGQVIGVLVITRFVGVAVWLWMLAQNIPLFGQETPDHLDSSAMWRFTGWLTVSNIVGPVMVQADRFYLASLFSPAAVAYYTVPLDTLSRATSLPLAAMNVVFPALAHSGSTSTEAARIVHGAVWFMLAFWALPIVLLNFVLGWLLTLWLGGDFATKALPVTQWLLLGILINGFAHIPFALLQSAGRADLTAKLHVAELPIYAILIVTLVAAFGIVGAAVAWTIRISLDAGLLYWLAHAHFPSLRKQLMLAPILATGAALVVFIINTSF